MHKVPFRNKKSLIFVITLVLFSMLFGSITQFQISSVKATNNIDLNTILTQIPRDSASPSQINWNSTEYTMLLITPAIPEFIDAAETFAEWKTLRGIPTLVVSNYSDYEGIDGPEKIRNTIIQYYNRYPLEYVLLLGDTGIIPIRYIYNNDGILLSTNEALGSSTDKPTDFYYADLTGNWNIDGDSHWGENSNYNGLTDESEVDYIAEVAVGRFPVDNVGEVYDIFNKTMNYEKATNAGDWMNRYLAVSGISDFSEYEQSWVDDKDGEDEAILNQYIIDNYIEGVMDWGHLMEHTAAYVPPDYGNVYELTSTSAMRQNLDIGCSIAVWAGHGGPNVFSTQTISSALTTSDVNLLTNTNMLPFIFADACSTNSYDYDSIGEALIKQSDTGAIGYVGSMRISWYYPNDTNLEALNRGVTKQFFHEMFQNGYYQQGKALYESKKAYVNGDWFSSLSEDFEWFETERKILFSYMLLGDPSVDIFTDNPGNFQSMDNIVSSWYEGSQIQFQAKDINGNYVPYAQLTLYSEDGLYKTFNADFQGYFNLNLPLGLRSYNYTLFGHNMVYKTGSFYVSSDNDAPQIISEILISPEQPTVDDQILISVALEDNASGVCDAYFLISENEDFTSLRYYSLQSTEIDPFYQVQLPKIKNNIYYYGIIAFDYSDNMNTTLSTQEIPILSIPVPNEWYFLIGLNVALCCGVAVGITVIALNFIQIRKKNEIEMEQMNWLLPEGFRQ